MMEYKTPMVAEKLGVSSKVVLRIVQQLHLNLAKNKFGHYLFTQEDIDQIRAYHEATKGMEEAAVTRVEESSIDTSSFQQQIQELVARMEKNEALIREKASDVVAYQVLQHRNEIEELTSRIKQLEERIAVLESRQSNVQPLHSYKTEKPKRKNMLLSMFGL